MSKAYWISTYQKINDPDKLAAYAALAGPAITAGGGKFIVRGMPVKTYEAGVNERTVVIEFDSIETAIATHDSPGYAAALGKSLIIMHGADHQHALKEVDAAALAVVETPAEIVRILRYVLDGTLSKG